MYTVQTVRRGAGRAEMSRSGVVRRPGQVRQNSTVAKLPIWVNPIRVYAALATRLNPLT
jgi:hypothetical protein